MSFELAFWAVTELAAIYFCLDGALPLRNLVYPSKVKQLDLWRISFHQELSVETSLVLESFLALHSQ